MLGCRYGTTGGMLPTLAVLSLTAFAAVNCRLERRRAYEVEYDGRLPNVLAKVYLTTVIDRVNRQALRIQQVDKVKRRLYGAYGIFPKLKY